MYRDNEESGIKILDIDDDESDLDGHEEPEDDEKRSISSESSISYSEVISEFQMRQKQIHKQSADFEIWRLFQVDDQNLKDIEHSDELLEMLTTTEIEGMPSFLLFIIFKVYLINI